MKLNFNLHRQLINHVHFIGIGGISMSAIAEVLLTLNYKVSGSDMKASKTTERLKEKGIQIFIGHSPDHISDCDLVVYTAAVKNDNAELLQARALGIPTIDRAEMLGLLMKEFDNSIAVSGTHGKTTTTSMISLIMEHCNYNPTIMVGGELDEIGGNLKIGGSQYFVTEACEYVESFLKFYPKTAVILNIEEDHLDYFRDIHHIVDAFDKFARLVPKDGHLIACSNDIHIQSLLPRVQCQVVTFGVQSPADYMAENIVYNEKGYPAFDVLYKEHTLSRIQLRIPGYHNIFNALASFATCHTLGAPTEKIIEKLSQFKGTHRRFDILDTVHNITVVDDYAHHPTEVKATLQAASKYPHQNLWCIFQPHTYTRTKALLSEFGTAFQDADKIIIADIYAAREKDTGEVHSKDLVEKIQEKNKNAVYINEFDNIASHIAENAEANDLVLTMGAGDINKVGELIIEKLKAKG